MPQSNIQKTPAFSETLHHEIITILTVVIVSFFTVPVLSKLVSFLSVFETEHPDLFKIYSVVFTFIVTFVLIGTINFYKRYRVYEQKAGLADGAFLTYYKPSNDHVIEAENRLKEKASLSEAICIIGASGAKTFGEEDSPLYKAIEECSDLKVLLLHPYGKGIRDRVESLLAGREGEGEGEGEGAWRRLGMSLGFCKQTRLLPQGEKEADEINLQKDSQDKSEKELDMEFNKKVEEELEKYRLEIKKSIRKLKDVYRQKKDGVQLGFYDDKPLSKLIILEHDFIWFQHYSKGSHVRDVPTYFLEKTGRSGDGIFKMFLEVFQRRWTNLITIKKEYLYDFEKGLIYDSTKNEDIPFP